MSRYFVEFNVAVNIICNIMMAPGCDRELNAHFYSGLTVVSDPRHFRVFHILDFFSDQADYYTNCSLA